MEKRLVLSGVGIVSGSVGSTVTVLGKLVLVVLKLELINVTTDDDGDVYTSNNVSTATRV